MRISLKIVYDFTAPLREDSFILSTVPGRDEFHALLHIVMKKAGTGWFED